MAGETRYQRLQRYAILAMAFCASISVMLIVAQQMEVPGPLYFETVVFMALTIVFVRQPGAWSEREKPPRAFDAMLVLGMLWPFLVGNVYAGLGIEYRIVLSLRTVGLITATVAFWPKMRRMTMLTNLLLMIFAFAASNSGWHFFTTLGYLVAATLWMVAGHWHEMEEHAASVAARGLPSFPAGLVSLLVVCSLVGGILVYPTHVETIEQMLRRVFGEGDDTLAAFEGTRIKEEQDDLMKLLAAEKYGSVLDDDTNANERDKFSTLRDPASAPQLPPDLGPLFHAKGPQAMHIPLATYGGFDGQDWLTESPRLRRDSGQLTPDGDWINMFNLAEIPLNREMAMAARNSEVDGDFYQEARELAAYLAAFGHDEATLESRLAKFKGRVREAFAAAPMLRGEAQYLITQHDFPALMDALADDPELRDQMLAALRSGDTDVIEEALLNWRKSSANIHLPPELEALVQEWVGDRPRGWSQVEAIVDGLRNNYEHDPMAGVPSDTQDSVSYFLLESKRGPDYLFASAATVLLRGMAYPSRMVGGFYAPPSRFGFFTGTAAIDERDIHYWAQVQLPSGVWVDIEPTPGYELPEPVVTWSEWASVNWAAVSGWSQRNAAAIGVVAVIVIIVMLLWTRIVDVAAWLFWRLRVRQPADRLVMHTWRLLEGRARRAGTTRPPGLTLGRWYPQLFVEDGEVQGTLRELARLANYIAFSSRTGQNAEHARELCRAAVESCTLGILRREKKRRLNQSSESDVGPTTPRPVLVES